MWIWIGVILIIGLGIYFLFPVDKLIIEHNDEPLAAKYAGFQEINEGYKSSVFEVSSVAKVVVSSAASPNPIRIFQSVNNQLIIDCDAKVNEDTKHDNRYYKLDTNGTVTDSIYIAYDGYWGNFIGRFIVYTKDKDAYYNTWPLNGDTTRRNLVELNADLAWDDENVEARIKAIKASAEYWFFSAVEDKSVWYRKTYFYQDKKWQILWQKTPGYVNVLDEEGPFRYRKDLFRTGEVDFDIPKNVKLLHFHQEEKMKYYHIIGGGDGGFSVYNWRGKGFFETKVAGRDFGFMVPKLVVEKERHHDYKPSLFTVEEPGSATDLYNPAFYHSPNGFSFYSPGAKELFLIRIKK